MNTIKNYQETRREVSVRVLVCMSFCHPLLSTACPVVVRTLQVSEAFKYIIKQ